VSLAPRTICHDEATAHARPERQKNEMLQIRPILAHAKVELRQRSRIAIMLHDHRQPWKRLGESSPEVHMVPSRQMGRVDEDALSNLERAAH